MTFINNFFSFLKTYLDKRSRLAYQIPDFAHANKDLLIIIADPKNDEIFVAYGDKMIRGRIGEAGSKQNLHVVKNILKFGRFKSENGIEKFLMEILAIVIDVRKKFPANVQFFFKALHDALYSLADGLRKNEKSRLIINK